MKKNRTVLITGVTSDIGREIASFYINAGWNIIGHYCSSTRKINRLKELVRGRGVSGHFLKADFTREPQLLKFIHKVKRFQIDALINNAGSYVIKKHFSLLSIKDIRGAFMVNAFAPMFLSSQLFEGMKRNKFGRIVNISSIAAKYGGSAFSMHYGCSKLAFEGVTRTLAREGARYGILVNTIRPGVIDTDFHKKFPKNMKERILLIPLKKMGKPKDVAEMVFYLGSEKNKYITNETLAISGGE